MKNRKYHFDIFIKRNYQKQIDLDFQGKQSVNNCLPSENEKRTLQLLICTVLWNGILLDAWISNISWKFP